MSGNKSFFVVALLGVLVTLCGAASSLEESVTQLVSGGYQILANDTTQTGDAQSDFEGRAVDQSRQIAVPIEDSEAQDTLLAAGYRPDVVEYAVRQEALETRKNDLEAKLEAANSRYNQALSDLSAAGRYSTLGFGLGDGVRNAQRKVDLVGREVTSLGSGRSEVEAQQQGLEKQRENFEHHGIPVYSSARRGRVVEP